MLVMAKKRKPKPWTDLIEARERRGHTQADAAALIGVSQGTWSSIESGARKPSAPLKVLLTLYITGKPLLPG